VVKLIASYVEDEEEENENDAGNENEDDAEDKNVNGLGPVSEEEMVKLLEDARAIAKEPLSTRHQTIASQLKAEVAMLEEQLIDKDDRIADLYARLRKQAATHAKHNKGKIHEMAHKLSMHEQPASKSLSGGGGGGGLHDGVESHMEEGVKREQALVMELDELKAELRAARNALKAHGATPLPLVMPWSQEELEHAASGGGGGGMIGAFELDELKKDILKTVREALSQGDNGSVNGRDGEVRISGDLASQVEGRLLERQKLGLLPTSMSGRMSGATSQAATPRTNLLGEPYPDVMFLDNPTATTTSSGTPAVAAAYGALHVASNVANAAAHLGGVKRTHADTRSGRVSGMIGLGAGSTGAMSSLKAKMQAIVRRTATMRLRPTASKRKLLLLQQQSGELKAIKDDVSQLSGITGGSGATRGSKEKTGDTISAKTLEKPLTSTTAAAAGVDGASTATLAQEEQGSVHDDNNNNNNDAVRVNVENDMREVDNEDNDGLEEEEEDAISEEVDKHLDVVFNELESGVGEELQQMEARHSAVHDALAGAEVTLLPHLLLFYSVVFCFCFCYLIAPFFALIWLQGVVLVLF
jgi:hypothetical protein